MLLYDTESLTWNSKAEYSALSSTRSQKKKLKQRQCPFNTVQVTILEFSPEVKLFYPIVSYRGAGRQQCS